MIPKDFVDECLQKSGGTTFFGVPIKDLTRDELIACAITGWEAEKAEKERVKQIISIIRNH